MSILSLQTAFPTFKNDGFIMEILTFLKHPSFVLEDRFGSVLALFRAPFGSSWGYFVSSLGLRTPRSTFVVPQAERRTLRSTFGAAKDERRTLRSTFGAPKDERRTFSSTFGPVHGCIRSYTIVYDCTQSCIIVYTLVEFTRPGKIALALTRLYTIVYNCV